jgi:hypothetical protein
MRQRPCAPYRQPPPPSCPYPSCTASRRYCILPPPLWVDSKNVSNARTGSGAIPVPARRTGASIAGLGNGERSNRPSCCLKSWLAVVEDSVKPRACLDVPDPVDGLAGPGPVLTSGIKVLTMCKRHGLAYPHVFWRQSAALENQTPNSRKAGDVVTGQTCESPRERPGGWKPTPLGATGFTDFV